MGNLQEIEKISRLMDAESLKQGTKLPHFFDLETDGVFPDLTKIHCIVIKNHGVSLSFGPDEIDLAVDHLSRAPVLCGHNIIGFDIPVLQHLFPGFKPKDVVLDTMVMSRLLWPSPELRSIDYARKNRKVPEDKVREIAGRHSLKAWGIRLGNWKGDYGDQADAWAEFDEEMLDYCEQDVEVTEALYNHLVKFGALDYPGALNLEHRLAEVIAHQERQGFTFDIQAAQKLYAELDSKVTPMLAEIQRQLPPIEPQCMGPYKNQQARMEREFPGKDWRDLEHRFAMTAAGIKFKWTKRQEFNPGSGKQIEERFKALGWKPTKYTEKGNVCTDAEVLIELGQQFPEAQALGEWAMLDKRLGQLANGDNAWLKMVGDDGKIHGRCDQMGTVTHRFAHFSPNMAQVPNTHAPYGPECRSLFIPQPGWDLVGCDADGLELRMLGHYMAPFDGGGFANEVVHGDIHTANQNAADLPTRDMAKVFIYALIYGGGDGQIGSIVGGGVAEGKALRARFYRRLPALKRLTDAVRKAAARTKKLKALDGRVLHVRSAHSALNTLLQSAGSIVVKTATVLFADDLRSQGLEMGPDWSLVAHVHDEWQTECRKELTDVVCKAGPAAVQRAGRALNLKVETTGTAQSGASWAETH